MEMFQILSPVITDVTSLADLEAQKQQALLQYLDELHLKLKAVALARVHDKDSKVVLLMKKLEAE